ncbi:MAG: hypothetical protein QOJ54_2509 [Aliidongia sp.]|nr:hypothetical protein [Aliidongia sp.]
MHNLMARIRVWRYLAAFVVAAWAFSPAMPALAATTVEGVFALINGTPQVAGELTATPAATPTDLKLDISLHRIAEKNALKRYDTELNRQMHVIAISDDLSVFIHHHVAHVIDGHGQVRMMFPAPGLYHIFVDAAPKTIGQQVLRFDLTVGDEPVTPLISRPLGTPETTARSGLYTVSFDRLDLIAGQPASVALHIAEHGKPAQDLHAYLGVGAHVVLIGAESMKYAHVHPLIEMTGPDMAKHDGAETAMADDDDQPVPADLTLHVPTLPAGQYKLWVQFLGGRTLHTVPFVVVVK